MNNVKADRANLAGILCNACKFPLAHCICAAGHDSRPVVEETYIAAEAERDRLLANLRHYEQRRKEQHPRFRITMRLRFGITVTVRDRSWGWSTERGFWRWHKATAL